MKKHWRIKVKCNSEIWQIDHKATLNRRAILDRQENYLFQKATTNKIRFTAKRRIRGWTEFRSHIVFAVCSMSLWQWGLELTLGKVGSSTQLWSLVCSENIAQQPLPGGNQTCTRRQLLAPTEYRSGAADGFCTPLNFSVGWRESTFLGCCKSPTRSGKSWTPVMVCHTGRMCSRGSAAGLTTHRSRWYQRLWTENWMRRMHARYQRKHLHPHRPAERHVL